MRACDLRVSAGTIVPIRDRRQRCVSLVSETAIGATSSRRPGTRARSRSAGDSSRALVALEPTRRATRSARRRASAAPFLAQLIATAEQAPQTRERRRAEPAEASAAYRVDRSRRVQRSCASSALSNRARSRPCADRSRRSARRAPSRSGSPARRPSGAGAHHDVVPARLQALDRRRRHAALDHASSRPRRTARGASIAVCTSMP